ncbi:MAG: tetratricopeptide repeat protein [Bacteroidales bacterium]
MSNNNKNVHNETAQNVGEVFSKTEIFIQKYGKLLTWGLIILIAIVAIYMAVMQFYVKPLKKEALGQMFVAEQLFRAENYDAALNGDGNALGFSQIIDEYGSKAGEVVYFYAGVSALKTNKAEEAISYLKKFDSDDPILMGRALSCVGDAYSINNDFKNAVSNYVKASKLANNQFSASYLLKAGIASEELGNKDQALKYYQEIKDNYPNTYEGSEIDKYITRLNIK